MGKRRGFSVSLGERRLVGGRSRCNGVLARRIGGRRASSNRRRPADSPRRRRRARRRPQRWAVSGNPSGKEMARAVEAALQPFADAVKQEPTRPEQVGRLRPYAASVKDGEFQCDVEPVETAPGFARVLPPGTTVNVTGLLMRSCVKEPCVASGFLRGGGRNRTAVRGFAVTKSGFVGVRMRTTVLVRVHASAERFSMIQGSCAIPCAMESGDG